MTAAQLVTALIRDVPDFPEPGILFRDLTPVLADRHALAAAVAAMAEAVGDADVIVGVEARGFLLGGAVAHQAGLGLVPVRKEGKLPRVAVSRSYELEYGTATLELPADVLSPGSRVHLVDDVLATGGTAAACCELVEQAGAEVTGIGVLLELVQLGGRDRLAGRAVHAVLTL
ncbi:MAG: adenine phosphoribosyltransferase [Pseudonocardiales bacterium]|nr:adenine phosphoribosyltransferase [Pseudonocardiales bacterium]